MATALTDLGRLLIHERKPEEAAKQLKMAIEIAQRGSQGYQEAVAHRILGDIYLSQGALPLGGMEHRTALDWYIQNNVPWPGIPIVMISPAAKTKEGDDKDKP